MQNPGKVTFNTSDGFTIHGLLYSPPKPNGKAIICLPKLNDTKSSYSEFASALSSLGWVVLAIDARGHGESILQDGQPKTWQQFTERDFNSMLQDISAAKAFLFEKSRYRKLFILGASIGANNALNYANAYPMQAAGVVLLSPGMNYRGVSTQQSSTSYSGAVFIASSAEDSYSFQSSEQIFKGLPSNDKVFEKLDNAGHGVVMMSAVPSLEKKIISWLEEH